MYVVRLKIENVGVFFMYFIISTGKITWKEEIHKILPFKVNFFFQREFQSKKPIGSQN